MSGVAGDLILQNNDGDDLSVSKDGSFSFATSLSEGAAYNVEVKSQPPGQSCAVSNGSGTIAQSNISNVAVICVDAIVFSSAASLDGSDAKNNASNIWVVGSNASGLKALTTLTAQGNHLNAIWSPNKTKIVFSSNRKNDGSDAINPNNSVSNIWVMNADGSGLTVLNPVTAANVGASTPVWSPDGTKIAFSASRKLDGSDAGGINNIWVMNADGSGLTHLTDTTAIGANHLNPQWSPDGTKIVFNSTRKLDGSNAANTNINTNNIWVINSNGTGLTPLTSATAANASSLNPQWSPDGTKIVFYSSRKLDGTDAANSNSTNNIWVVNSNGTGLTALTSLTAANANNLLPRWSPDGTKIVYRSARKFDGSDAVNTNNVANIWVIKADGSGASALTQKTGSGIVSTTPVWSSDGTKIIFSALLALDGSDALGIQNIWIMKSDGSGVTSLTSKTAAGATSNSPAWPL